MAEKFVVATDEVWRLQRGTDPECRYFRQMADHGHYRGKNGTRQGIYVMSAGGSLLASVNALNVKRVLETMKKGLEAWAVLPAEKRKLTDPDLVKPSHRWESSLPKGGMVLSSFSRELPTAFDEHAKRGPWNRDHAWFTAKEARSFFSKKAEVGEVHQVPRGLIERLARFHFVDNIIGQGLPFAQEEALVAKMETIVAAVDGNLVSFRMRGESKTVAKGPWLMKGSEFEPNIECPRGVVTTMHGHGTFDLKLGKMTKFELLAVGESWGRTPYNRRRTDGTEKTPIGFFLRLTGNDMGGSVAPAFVSEGYGPWIKPKPKVTVDPARGTRK